MAHVYVSLSLTEHLETLRVKKIALSCRVLGVILEGATFQAENDDES